MEESFEHKHERRAGGFMGMLDHVYEFFVGALSTVARDMELFIGTALTLIGILSIEADKFCDGNTADYLSCTRPSTYYFYSPLDTAIIVIGVFFILIWIRRRRS